MKLRMTFKTMLFMVALTGLAASWCMAATLDITDLRVTGQTLTLKTVIDGGQASLKAGGFVLTFPADRLEFTGTADIDGVILQTAVQGCSLNAGYMVATGALKRMEILFNFHVTGPAPYIIAANSEELKDDLAGNAGIRPGIHGTPSPDEPVMWSVPDNKADLFFYVPDLTGITALNLFAGSQDILPGLLGLSDWYVDPVRDIAYLVLPGLQLPSGQYPLRLVVGYGDRTEQITADVIVK